MARTALVTGGSGFIGSRLVRMLLNEGHAVRVLDVREGFLRGENESRLEFVGLGADDVRGGVMDPAAIGRSIQGVDVVYHLALNWDGHSWSGARPLADLLDVNLRGTLNILEAARSHSVKHLLFSSSVAVYGKRDSPVMDEETICRPELWRGGPGPGYAITKLATERLCLMYHVERGLPVTVFRIDVVFDDDDYQDLSEETIRTALRGDPLKVERFDSGAGIHVEDVARAFLMATLNERAYGQVFNLSNPHAYMSDLDVVKLVIDSIGSKSRIEFIETPLTGPVIGSVAKLQDLIGWKPLKRREDLEQAIVRMTRRVAHGHDRRRVASAGQPRF